MAHRGRIVIPGSERHMEPQARRVGDADATAEIEVTVYLRPRTSATELDKAVAESPHERRPMTAAEFATAYSAHEDDAERIEAFAVAHDLTVTEVDLARRTVVLRGTVGDFAHAFAVQELGLFEYSASGVFRGRTGPLTVPAELSDIVTGVFGIDDRPQAEAHLRTAANAATSYTPLEIAEAYRFPRNEAGEGQTVAIIELGGGYRDADLTVYFRELGLEVPAVTAVSVDGATNAPGSAADTEVALDIEVVGAVANDAAIAVYFAPNSDRGFIDAVSTALHDQKNAPAVVGISWGAAEERWTGQARSQMEQLFIDAALLGVTVLAAAGDSGSSDGVDDKRQHVDFPASAPHCVACGGTTLELSNGRISSETVWNDVGGGATGGGVSDAFDLPEYQKNVGVPLNVDTQKAGRGVPDVAGNADPATGYRIRVNGEEITIGGTSAVAPLWAGLVARINGAIGGRIGFLQPQLYALAKTPSFRDITLGENGAYSAAPGWDACTGLGSPNGEALLAKLQRAPDPASA